MTPERWAHVRQVFDGALERAAKDRAAYLRVVCARDDELRREVETLLASHDQSEDFLATPAAHLSQILASDSQIDRRTRTTATIFPAAIAWVPISSSGESAAAAWARCGWRRGMTASIKKKLP